MFSYGRSSLSNDRTSEANDRSLSSNDRTSEANDQSLAYLSEDEQILIQSVAKTGKTPQIKVRQAISILCQTEYLTRHDLGKHLDRDPSSIRKRYLNPMVKEGILVMLHPDKPNHPAQAYRVKQGDSS